MQKPTPQTSNGEHQPHEEDPATDSDNFVHDSSSQVPPQIHHGNMNGMPPQQVYVSGVDPNVAGLETQFQSLGMQHPSEGMMNGHHHHADGDFEQGEGNEDGEEGDDDPLKLFVGQVSNADASRFMVW